MPVVMPLPRVCLRLQLDRHWLGTEPAITAGHDAGAHAWSGCALSTVTHAQDILKSDCYQRRLNCVDNTKSTERRSMEVWWGNYCSRFSFHLQ